MNNDLQSVSKVRLMLQIQMDGDKELLIGNASFLAECGFWERKPDLHPERWIRNFTPDELPYALSLLNSFIFISDYSTKRLLKSAFSKLSKELVSNNSGSYRKAMFDLEEVISKCIVTFPTGEDPNPSDSGYTFIRLTRQELDVSQDNLKDNEGALRAIINDGVRKIIFVDDLVGSGNQFMDTLFRDHEIGGSNCSFYEASNKYGDLELYYVPIICTEYGKKEILKHFPKVKILPAYEIDESYAANEPNSYVWDKSLNFDDAMQFVVQTSKRAGIEVDPFGFHGLGLALSFQHCMPDATLPLFFHEGPDWKPLKRRS